MSRHHILHPVSDAQSGDGSHARSSLAQASSNGLRGPTPPLVEDLLTELAGLRRRLDTLPIIEQSKGILIGYYGIDADTAFSLLRRWSSHHNIKLRDISQLLVDAATVPPSPGQQPRQSLEELIRGLQGRDDPASAS